MELMQGFVIAVCVFVLGRVVWGFISSGRVEKKAVYMTHEDCKQNRENMCIGKTALAEYKAHADTKLSEFEKRLDQGSEDFRAINDQILILSGQMSRVETLLETKVERIIIKE